MELNEILSLVGKTIYATKEKTVCNKISENTYYVTGETVYKYEEYIVEEVRFPYDKHFYSDKENYDVVFIFNMEYEDCYDYFGINDIGKTIFFTEDEAKQAIKELNEQKEV